MRALNSGDQIGLDANNPEGALPQPRPSPSPSPKPYPTPTLTLTPTLTQPIP
jgi:hypothetical protein